MSEESLQNVKTQVNMTYSEELSLLKSLFDKYGLKTISEYSTETNTPRQTIYNRINRGDIPSIELGGTTFIIEM